MDGLAFLILVVVLILIVSPILAGIALSRSGRALRMLETALALIESQGNEIVWLRSQVARLKGEAPPDAAVPEPETVAPETMQATEAATTEAEAKASPPEPPEIQAHPEPAAAISFDWTRTSLERQFGAVLPVWIGGIALAFGGFFLVKYSIENELLGPTARVIFGVLLGIALLAGARFVSTRSSLPESYRIAQSLNGAGIAVFYVVGYAATELYQLVPPLAGSLAMLANTMLAVILAIRHGPPIALIGMAGGFLTPALIHSGEPSAFLLFSYLYFVFAALMIVIRRQGWWLLALPTLAFALFWVLFWVFAGPAKPDETVWIGIFLVAVAGTIVAASRERYEEEARAIRSWRNIFSWKNRILALNVLALAGSLSLMAAVAFDASFSVHDWVLFGVLALGAVALAFFNTPLYGFAPWMAMAVTAVMLSSWYPEATREFAAALIAFGALYVVSGLLLFTNSVFPLLWAGLAAASALGYFLLGYFRLHTVVPAQPQPQPVLTPPSTQPVEPLVEAARETAASLTHVWGGIALAFSILFLTTTFWAVRRMSTGLEKDRVLAGFATTHRVGYSAEKERVLAVFSLATTAFLAIALSIELKREFLSVAIAAELLAVAWMTTKTDIASLRTIVGLLGLGFAFLLLPQIVLIVQLSAFYIVNAELHWQDTVPIVTYPTFQLALPAAFFLAAAWLLRPRNDSTLVRALEYSAIALLGLWGYYTTSQLFHPGENVLFAKGTFVERGAITNVLFAYGIGCLVAGRLLRRETFWQGGIVLAAAALFRIVYFDLLTQNPLSYPGGVAGWPILNGLALTFLVPILWVWLLAKELAATGNPRYEQLANRALILPLIFVFAWISFEIRRLYHGAPMTAGPTTNAEFYSYSLAWLLFGLMLLFFGTLKGNQMLRYASLGVVLLTVTKVFLLDTGNLTGLYRVFSFLGLGVSLLGLSYFYGRFVFGSAEETAESGAPPS